MDAALVDTAPSAHGHTFPSGSSASEHAAAVGDQALGPSARPVPEQAAGSVGAAAWSGPGHDAASGLGHDATAAPGHTFSRGGSIPGHSAGAGEWAAGYHESDAAHLAMCLVMLAMLIFPAAASPAAVRGVLTAMVVVFAGLLVSRVVQWHADSHAMPGDRLMPLGYHTATAAAMLYAMSGHTPTGHTGGPAVVPALIIAGLFAADALLVTLACATGRAAVNTPGGLGIVRYAGGCVVAWTGPRKRSAMVPHVVMDLGTAYMLIAAVSN
ncbi:DUF5134 domain-containing protein [Nocardia altamirensis]|uniref:DUF5134 domain-containing protein n=1 Tax=Nocardia altamirensis TaxID=472158 RepID=UPI000A01566D|nr:DUF5134 domain-containing protein [Nocardia altamirensis]